VLGRNRSEPWLFQYVNVEELVPGSHFPRKVNVVLELSFVREAAAECYSASLGRPSVDPELARTCTIWATASCATRSAPWGCGGSAG
jgi:transposase